MKSVEAPDPKTVIFHLKAPGRDLAVRPHDGLRGDRASDTYPGRQAAAARTRSSAPVATRCHSYEPGTQTVLTKSDSYTGGDPAEERHGRSSSTHKTSSDLALAAEAGRGGHRLPEPQPDRPRLPRRAERGSRSSRGNGIEIRYLVFNLDLQPGDERRAEAGDPPGGRLHDRPEAIASKVYNGTVEPLYSMVPQGLKYATEPFKDEYGDDARRGRGQADAAAGRREDAGAAGDLVHAVPLRAGVGRRVRRDQAASSTTAGCST